MMQMMLKLWVEIPPHPNKIPLVKPVHYPINMYTVFRFKAEFWRSEVSEYYYKLCFFINNLQF